MHDVKMNGQRKIPTEPAKKPPSKPPSPPKEEGKEEYPYRQMFEKCLGGNFNRRRVLIYFRVLALSVLSRNENKTFNTC